MKILLINHYAGSIRHGMEYRPYYLAREWMKLGHDVTIVAASESHVRTQSPSVAAAITEETVDGISYVWVKTPPYNGNGVWRSINMFSFVRQLHRHRRPFAAKYRPDVVIASSTYPLDNVPAHRIARLASAKLVYEVHDLWPLSPIELAGMSPRHPFIRVMQRAEDYAYRNADRVVSMLPNAAAHMEAHGMCPDKFAYVPNGINVQEWQDRGTPLPPEHEARLSALRTEGRFVIGYAGAHGIANSLGTILDAAIRLRDTEVTFVLVGQGPERAALRERATKMGLTNVCFLPPVPKTAIRELLNRMDVLYIGLQRTPIFRFGISPNKLMDYMMAAKPVIMAIDAGNDIVAESGCGISVPAEDPQALSCAALELMGRTTEDRERMGKCGSAYVLEHHDYSVLAQRFLAALE